MRQLQKITRAGFLLLSIFCLTAIINCGGNSKTAQAPESMVKNYLAKSQIMVDTSLADFYVSDERAAVTARINQSIANHKKDGSLDALKAATFDFSGLQINVLAQKEEYIQDEPFNFMKVSANGNIVMQTADNSKNIGINDVIILEMIGNEWKVTEKINPFG